MIFINGFNAEEETKAYKTAKVKKIFIRYLVYNKLFTSFECVTFHIYL